MTLLLNLAVVRQIAGVSGLGVEMREKLLPGSEIHVISVNVARCLEHTAVSIV
jgi:hypothetical protein